jgi:hypothetical protein
LSRQYALGLFIIAAICRSTEAMNTTIEVESG